MFVFDFVCVCFKTQAPTKQNTAIVCWASQRRLCVSVSALSSNISVRQSSMPPRGCYCPLDAASTFGLFSLLNFLQPNPDEKKSQYCCNISVRRSSRVTFCRLSLNFTIIRRGCVTTRCAFNNKIQQSGFLYNFFFHTFYHYIRTRKMRRKKLFLVSISFQDFNQMDPLAPQFDYCNL